MNFVQSRTSVPAAARLSYLLRIARVYVKPSSGPLSFWYERPEINPAAFPGGRQYYMCFQGKARYKGPFDRDGVPILDYQGDIGPQHNPIAIAQYGLARFNQWCRTGAVTDRAAWVAVADWLSTRVQPNPHGVPVWMHHFDWPYRQTLQAPWYSGLAQGSGLSMLVRAARETGNATYAEAAHRAYVAFERQVTEGGVIAIDDRGDTWIEEYLVDPPSHILNGFIWGSWGVLDYAGWSGRASAADLWNRCVATLEQRLGDFDAGRWSLYEAPLNGRRMLASAYYHQLHITQLRVLHRLTGRPSFDEAAARFERYAASPLRRASAFAEKAWFKLTNY
jgi:hypothetical protein